MTFPLLAALIFGSTGVAVAEPLAQPRTVSVRGTGEVRAVPDEVSFSLRVWKTSMSPVKARQSMAKSAKRILAALKRNGVAEKDLRTAQTSLRAQYRRDQGRRTLTGYRAATTITVRARNIAGYDRLVSAATEAGANELQGVHFSHSRLDDIEREARRKAVEDAHDKAQLLATSAGARLGRVYSIDENGTLRPQGHLQTMERAAAGPSNEPSLAAGEIAVTVNVRVVWELAD